MSEPRPYPFDAWPRLPRADAALLRRCARRLPAVPSARFAEVAKARLGVAATVQARPPTWCAAEKLEAALTDPLVAVVLEPEGGASRVAVELDPHLAARVVDRALGGEGGDGVPPPVRPLADAERGALAWFAAALAADSGFSVRTVVTTPRALASALGDAGALRWPLTVGLGRDRGTACAWVPEAALAGAPAPAPAAGGIALGTLPLTMVLEAGRGTLPAAELRGLRRGDVVLPDEMWARPEATGIGGGALLRVRGARRSRFRCAFDGGTLSDLGTVRIEGVERGAEAPAGEGRRMAEGETAGTMDGALGLAGDAPVELSVELARFSMPLEELSALRAGEVLVTGRAVGERVTLRAGDRAIATGELVDVDGEVGVRVLGVAE